METIPGKNTSGILKRTVKIFIYFFIICLLIFIFLVGFILYGIYQIYIPASSGQSQTVQIEKGQGAKEIAKNFEEHKLIRSAFWFETYIWLEGKQNQLQAGQYSIDPSLSTAQIVDMLAQGKVVENEIWVTIPEGFTSKQTEARLIESGLDSGVSGEKAENYKSKYNFLIDAPAKVGLQGFLFPDTYKFRKEDDLDSIIIKMLDNFDDKLTGQMRSDIKNQNRSIFEIVTMASILEKEVNSSGERKIASGIFWKRIKDNYPLESDATLSYILGDKEVSHSIEDTKIDSPYNSYRYKGLPPTPINNPGLDALLAAIYPQESDYYFFLTKPDTGEAVFSKTLQEHNLNIVKYLK